MATSRPTTAGQPYRFLQHSTFNIQHSTFNIHQSEILPPTTPMATSGPTTAGQPYRPSTINIQHSSIINSSTYHADGDKWADHGGSALPFKSGPTVASTGVTQGRWHSRSVSSSGIHSLVACWGGLMRWRLSISNGDGADSYRSAREAGQTPDECESGGAHFLDHAVHRDPGNAVAGVFSE
jgi:hypothetical protein